MLTYFIKGGPVMWPILILSIFALALIIERCWALLRMRIDIPGLASELIGLAQRGQYQKALARCEETKNPVAKVFSEGITNRGKRDVEELMERAGDIYVRTMERGMGILLVVVGVEPMLGFLGTITGLIRAFQSWEQMGTSITVSALAAGIYEAMITTAAGLIVAIPAYLAYHSLVGVIKRKTELVNYWGTELLSSMSNGRREILP